MFNSYKYFYFQIQITIYGLGAVSKFRVENYLFNEIIDQNLSNDLHQPMIMLYLKVVYLLPTVKFTYDNGY